MILRMSSLGMFLIIGVVGGLTRSLGGHPAEPAGPPVQVVRTANAPDEVRLRRMGNGHFFVHATVNGQLVRFMIDTGATNVVLTMADAERVGIPLKDRPMRRIGTGASGPVYGQMARLDTVEVEGRQVTNLEAMVADGLDISLLGQDYLTRIGTLQMAGDTMVLR